MKQFLIILLFVGFGIPTLQAQTIGHATIKNAKDIIWFGVDCSQMQCIGKFGFTNPEDIAKRMVHEWNDLFIIEHKKFNINGAFKKDDFIYDLQPVEAQNESIDPKTLVVSDPHKFDEAIIQKLIQNYVNEQYAKGLGLVFIVETLNKLETHSKVHVVFFDIDSKEIVQAVKYTGKPGGFGFRNYWANSFYDIIEQLGKDYHRWYKRNR